MKFFITVFLCFFSIFSFAAQYISSVTERITAAEVVSDAANIAKWSVRRPQMNKVYKSKMPGADVTISFNEDNGGLDFSYFPYVFGKNPMLNSVVLSLAHIPREMFNKYNAISCDIYADIPNRASIWFEVGGSKWTQANCPLIPRQWNRITICWSQQTPEQARKIKSLVFSRQNFHRLPGDPQWTEYHIKNIRFENIITGTETTWDVSPEKIVIPQCGYAPDYIKTAAFSHLHQADDFTVIKNNKVVFKGKLTLLENAHGKFKIADFTPVKEEGTYLIRSGNLESVPFEIAQYNMKKAADLNMNFLYSMRSGMATPAHPACYLDDCVRSDNRKQVDVSGGWFDASDLRGYHSMAIKTIMRPLVISQQFNTPAIYDEALWGAKLLAKLYDPESGMPYTVHSLYPKNHPEKRMADLFKLRHFYKVNNYWTDNKPNSGDERVIHVAKGTYICHPDLQDNHWGMTAAGVQFYLYSKQLGKDKELADKVMALSKKHFDFMCDADAKTLRKNGIGPYYQYKNNAVSLLLENAINFYLATNKTYYREKAFTYADVLLRRQMRNVITTPHGSLLGFFGNDDRKNTAGIFTDMQYVNNLLKVADTFPDKEISNRIIAALQIYKDFYTKNPAAYIAPYGIPYNFTMAKPKVNFSAELGSTADGKKWYGICPTGFFMGGIGALSLDNLALAQYMNDAELQQYAANMLYYLYGNNQAGRSLVANVGANYKRDIMSSALGWIPGMGNNPDVVRGVPNIPYHRHYHANEIYTQTQGNFAVATSILAAPACMTFNFKNLPASTSLEVFDNGKKIQTFKALKDTLTFELAGTKEYEFVFSNGLRFKRTMLRGDKINMNIDMNNFVLPMQINGKKSVKAGDTVEFELPIYAFGKDIKEVWFSAFGDNISLEKSSLSVNAASGKNAVLKIKGTVKKANAPFAVVIRPKADLRTFRAFSGIVR